ncbi:WXG100 family type VII secretion target [Mycobacterium sp. SP-6446]|uniref:WXG100 family type VII secretion target n=1 Tax=Mycobacterium sp. SP-6446 TaxID=1834162 RepID=UPI00096F0389|nr:WXG100 family type VII secretion target [Mycobacterium sp. SP-6446]OMC13532.1 hypothetical protein A5736_23045 [Mycobacterium sp. SP-6446]
MIEYLDFLGPVGHPDGMDLKVDPDFLRLAAADVSASRDSVRMILDDLGSELASRGTSWENGSFGRTFAGGANGYLAAKNQLFQSTQNLATTLDHLSSAMSTAANAWAITDGEPEPRIGR